MVQKPRPPIDDEDDKPAGETVDAEAAPSLPPTKLELFQLKVQLLWRRVDDYIWSREPARVPTITTCIAVLLLCGMGFWQLSRLEWKNDMIRSIHDSLASKPVDMRARYPQNDAEWKKYDYRPAIVKGTWLTVHKFRMIPRTFEGQVGYHLIVPLKLENNQIIFVNRGFVPDNAKILPSEEEKVFAVQGILRLPETRKTWATPENVPSRGVWTWADLAAMRHEIGVNSAAPVILYEARNQTQDSYPIGGQLPVPLYNRHRQYAFIWFALAIAFVGIWMIASKPKEKIKPTDEAAAANDDERMKDPVARRGLYPEATD